MRNALIIMILCLPLLLTGCSDSYPQIYDEPTITPAVEPSPDVSSESPIASVAKPSPEEESESTTPALEETSLPDPLIEPDSDVVVSTGETSIKTSNVNFWEIPSLTNQVRDKIKILPKYNSMVYFNDLVYATTPNGELFASFDGDRWDLVVGYDPAAINGKLSVVNGHMYFGIHDLNSDTHHLFVTKTGYSWDRCELSKNSQANEIKPEQVSGFAYFDGLYYMVNGNEVLHSIDGITWDFDKMFDAMDVSVIYKPTCLILYGGRFQNYGEVLGGAYCAIGVSEGIKPSDEYMIKKIVPSGDGYMAVTYDNLLLHSVDGYEWEEIINPEIDHKLIYDITFDSKNIVALGTYRDNLDLVGLYFIGKDDKIGWTATEVRISGDNCSEIIAANGVYLVY